MRIHHVRNATMVIQTDHAAILVDPMLSAVGQLAPYAWLRHKPSRNPLVALPSHTEDLLSKVTHCLITHSQKWGVRALQHMDHLDPPGEAFLRDRRVPVVTGHDDMTALRRIGIDVTAGLRPWKTQPFIGGHITAVPAQHGRGWVRHLMANGVGFFLELPGEPTLYISGDTVLTGDVKRALRDYNPDIAVMAAGNASLDIGAPILMPVDELLDFAQRAPGIVIANHLEALNHCPTSRVALRSALERKGIGAKVRIPGDGEEMTFEISETLPE